MAKTKKNPKMKSKLKSKAAKPKAKSAKAKKPTKLAAKPKSTAAKLKAKAAKKTSSKATAAKVKTAKSKTTKNQVAKSAGVKAKSAPKLTLVKSTPKLGSKTTSKSLGFLTPLDDRILIEKLGASDRTPGGLYIPDMAQERPNKGKVVAVGHGRRDKKGRIRPLDVQVGDVVLFTQWAGGEIELDGSTYLIMREGDLLGVSLE